jgi:phosphoribosylformylglycinamidine synthase subunit PurS
MTEIQAFYVTKYLVTIVIENRTEIDDPEGQTIYRDLILRGGYSSVQSVRTGKCLKITIESKSKKTAGKQVTKMCNELRIYNPIVSTCVIDQIDVIS